VLWMMMIHFGYYLIQRKEIATKRAAFIIGFLYFMNSTFLHVSTALEIVSNISFFIITTLLVLLLHRDKQRFEWIASLVFWFLFIVYKYYQYVWDLVHQSILCLIVGLLLIGMSYYIQRKNNVQSNHTYKIRYKLPIILAIIVLQFAFIGYQTGTSEHLLKEGTSIKLELKP